MAERGDPEVLKHVVVFLRNKTGMIQAEFGRAAGRLSQSDISDFELGKVAPLDDALRRMAEVAEVPWHVVLHLVRFLTAALEAVKKGARASAAEFDRSFLDAVSLALMPYLIEQEIAAARLPVEEALREGEVVWRVLESLSADERRRRIEAAPPGACRSWAALARTVCEASERLAAESAGEALELARLAQLIAGKVPGEEGEKAKSFGWGYLGNARRVGNDFDGADDAFARAWESWPAGIGSEWFPKWRLLDLEASLRRAQHRWTEALERLDRARACSGGDTLAAARILLKKSNVFHQMGEAQKALDVLEEAAPLVESLGDPHLLFALRFNTADNLARLERHEEAARLRPEVDRLAAGQAKGLDSIRVVWLGAKVKAGTGRKEEAMADLERVQDAFAAEELPYDAALAGLDLSVLWLEAGRTAVVRELAEAMAWIFVSKKIHREALASLAVFCEAAKQEAATVALARQVIGEVEKARRTGPPSAD